MAPSTRALRVTKRQTPLQRFTKVSKFVQNELVTKLAVIEADKAGSSTRLPKQIDRGTKRRRSEENADRDAESDVQSTSISTRKRTKIQLPSPPASQQDEESCIEIDRSPSLELHQLSLDTRPSDDLLSSQELPEALVDLISLHQSFLRAFTVHIAHNGKATPADLPTILGTVTRLWKRRAVTQDHLQRMLSLYEISTGAEITPVLLQHSKGPFKLIQTGLGDSVRLTIEYTECNQQGTSHCAVFQESTLQKEYEAKVRAIWDLQQDRSNSFIYENGPQFPRLAFEIGNQTQTRREKTSAARAEILGLSSSGERRTTKALAQSPQIVATEAKTPQALKARTLSLFDRVRAKQLANSGALAPSPEAILRRRAIGHIHEVVEILRMKQQQKQGSMFASSVHSSPGKVRGKVSFSMNQMVYHVKSSLSVPIGEDEIRMCISILSKDVPGTWLTLYDMGNVQTIILNGPGMSGIEVQRILLEDSKA